MRYTVMTWKKGEFVGHARWFKTLTEAHFYINRSGAIKGYIEDGATGEIIERFGD